MTKTQKKRKNERKTDYKARLTLLKSEIPRIVVRKTNKYLIAQYVKSYEGQDSIIVGVTSKDLLDYGWDKKYKVKPIIEGDFDFYKITFPFTKSGTITNTTTYTTTFIQFVKALSVKNPRKTEPDA